MNKIEQLAATLVRLGCPVDKSGEMAMQLDRRAQQLAVAKNRTYDESMAYLLGLMKLGWAAQDQGGAKEEKKPGASIPPGMVPKSKGGATGSASSHAS